MTEKKCALLVRIDGWIGLGKGNEEDHHREREKDIIPSSIEVERSPRAARPGSAETISSSVQWRIESSGELTLA